VRREKKRVNYYPFGLKHQGYNNVINGSHHPYGFGGKEEQDELGLGWVDITARNYDPALGRWMNLDPLAEDMRRHSPYNYAFDNPVYFQDPDGMKPFGSTNPVKKLLKRAAKNIGRSGRQARLRALANDPKLGSADRGWFKNEMRRIKNKGRGAIRMPGNSRNSKGPGKVLAHERGREADKGFSFKHANMQDTDLHKLQHKYDNNGKKNKIRPVLNGATALAVAGTSSSNAENGSMETVNNDTNNNQTSEDWTDTFAKKAVSIGAEVTNFVENIGTSIFGNDSELGKSLNELNPINLGLSDIFKTSDELLNDEKKTEN